MAKTHVQKEPYTLGDWSNDNALDRHIEAHLRAERIPGAALAIVQDEEIVYARGFGVTSVEDDGTAVVPETLFRIGSVTKPLVGTAVMRLVESGLLDLDTPVKNYVAWLHFSEPGAAHRITLRQLMSHTAGLPTDSRRGDQDLEGYIREQMPLYRFVAPPGRLFSYSNPGLNLVGFVAQQVVDKPFPALMRGLVFGPLEMGSTTYESRVTPARAVAQPYGLRPDGTLYVQHDLGDSIAYQPSGWAFSTVLDLAHFAMFHLHRGRFNGQQLLAPESVAEMHRRHACEGILMDGGYGLTFETTTRRGTRLVGHNGHLGAFGARLVIMPERGQAFIVLVNRMSGMEQLVSLVLDHLVGPFPEPLRSIVTDPEKSWWPNFVGRYVGVRTGLAVIKIEGDTLVLNLNGVVLPLLAHGTHVYSARRAGSEATIGVEFLSEDDRTTRYVRFDRWVCQRWQPAADFTPDVSALAHLEGVYEGTVDPDIITVHVVDGRLWLRSDDLQVDVPCVPLTATDFACDLGLAEFQMADDRDAVVLTMLGVYPFVRIHAEEETDLR